MATALSSSFSHVVASVHHHGPIILRSDGHGGTYVTGWGAFFWLMTLFVIFLWIVSRKAKV